MRKIHFLLFVFLFPTLVFGQNLKIDSLKIELSKTGQDTLKINTLNLLSEELMHANQYDSALRYMATSKELAEKIQFEQGSTSTYQNLAIYYLHQKNYVEAQVFLLKSLDVFLKANNREAIADTYLSLYYVNEKQLNYMPALENYKKHIIYRDSLANEKKQMEAALVVTAFETNKEETFATYNAYIFASVKEQKKEFVLTAGIITSLLALALIALLINMGRTKRTNSAIVTENEATVLALENKIATLKREKEESDILHREREDYFAEQAAAIEALAVEKEETAIVEPTIFIEPTTDLPTVETTVDHDSITIKEFVPITATAQFISFAAHSLDGKISLNWSTAHGADIAYFEVDKSMDNQQFITIETIASMGFNDNGYQTFDLQPLPGHNYYRINMVDKKGATVYSQTAEVTSTTNVLLDLIRYPNPVKEVMMVTAVGGKAKVSVTIFDKVGEPVFNIEVPPTTTPIYLTDIEPGNYTLQMKSQGKLVVQKLVKL